MKIKMNIQSAAIILLLALVFQSLSATGPGNRKRIAEQEFIVLRGRVIDAETKSPLVFASIAVTESNVGIITNIDGEFTLKISPDLVNHSIEVSFLGYKNKVIAVSSLRDDGYKNTITLETAPIPIREVVVRPLDPEAIVEKAISRQGKN
jgi:hypothetical protein